MITVRTAEELRTAVRAAKAAGATVGLVPTMGFLHAGHLSLIDALRAAGADFVVVSIFVNPTQFGPHEDFTSYPRDEHRDAALLRQKGVQVLFAPSTEVMYPAGAQTSVDVGPVAEPLEGERRPGHFEGVATIVLKLLNLVSPEIAAFGRKDAQQCAVVTALVRDLHVPVRLLFGPTVRENDGLALSSRNTYLSAEERRAAPGLHRSLASGAEALVEQGANAAEAEIVMRRTLAEYPLLRLDYLRVVDPRTFRTPEGDEHEVLVVGAAYAGKTRLIDNIPVVKHA